MFEATFAADRGVYLGHDIRGWCHASPQQSVMVLGPPRSGKTTSLIIPNVLASPGAVISTSTKPDVLDATIGARSRLGRCLLFDPTGTTETNARLEPLRWSPLQSCFEWTGSLATARALVEVGTGGGAGGLSRAEHSHWTERAQALLAPLLHAASLANCDMRTVLTWVDRRKALPAQQILAAEGGPEAELPRNLLDGIVATEERELSGIWSTASGALAGFRSEHALESTRAPDFDPYRFVRSTDTVYVAAPAHRQALVAPMVVGLVNDVRFATFAREAAGTADRPVLLALDELANIAPIPDLPSMVSEGGGQGLVTLACFQDLSQARQRWPAHAEGFPSLFGTTVVLPGIGDVRTLDALSLLAGEEELLVRSASLGRTLTERPLTDLLTGGRTQLGSSVATEWRRRLPVDLIARGTSGYALAFDERNRAAWIPLAPSHSTEPWRSLRRLELGVEMRPVARSLSRDAGLGRDFGNQLGR
ncbi:MAG: type IV secretory system conjugative DNA transfer family protein [Acidimicrobiales bacterium]